jgi:hypothetical protein
MCEGVGAAVARNELSPTSKRSWCFSMSAWLGGSSGETKAMRAPSGRQANCSTPRGAPVTCCGSPPFMGSTKICSAAFFSSPVSARNASRSPGWKHRRFSARLPSRIFAAGPQPDPAQRWQGAPLGFRQETFRRMGPNFSSSWA